MSKDTHTGLFSNEAYDALTLVSAINQFSQNVSQGYDKKCMTNFFKTKIPVDAFFYSPCNVTNYWTATAEVTRDATNGEIIIKDFVSDDRKNYKPINITHFQSNWARPDIFNNSEKLHLLAKGIQSTAEFLVMAFKGKEEITLEMTGPSWLEPENYHGYWYADWTTMCDYPERTKKLTVKISTLEALIYYFTDAIGKNCFTDLIGEVWDPFKAHANAEIRDCQLKLWYKGFVERDRIINGYTNAMRSFDIKLVMKLTTESFIRLEREQRAMEKELL